MTWLLASGAAVVSVCCWWPHFMTKCVGGAHRINHSAADHLCPRCRRWAALKSDDQRNPERRPLQGTCEGALALHVRRLRVLHREMHDGAVAHDGGAQFDDLDDEKVAKSIRLDRHRVRPLNPLVRCVAGRIAAAPHKDSTDYVLFFVPPFVLGAMYGAVALLVVILRG